MKKLFFFVFLIALFSGISAQNYYDKTYNIGFIDHPTSFETDSLENVYVCGWFEDENTQNQRGFVLKTDNNGQEIWRVTMPDSSKFYELCLTHYGGVAVAGSRNNLCSVTLFDTQTGTQLWEYEEPESEGYWFATSREFIDSATYKILAVRTKLGPHLIWYYHINSENGTYLSQFKSINNTIYGLTYTSSLLEPDIVWVGSDYDSGWSFVMNRNYGPLGSSYWEFSSLHIAGVHSYSDNVGCVVRYYPYWGLYYMSVLTMDYTVFDVYGNSFEIAHDKFRVMGSDKFENDKFLITGSIDQDLAMWFIDHDLTYMEEEIIPTSKPRLGVDVIGLTTMDMVLMGTEEEGNGATNVFLMKLNYNGTVSTQENAMPVDFTVYPNPAKDNLWIKTNKTGLQHAQVCIVNTVGMSVSTSIGLNNPVSLSGLSQGLYIVLVMNNNKVVYRQKFIKY